jgi:hypothetical protein
MLLQGMEAGGFFPDKKQRGWLSHELQSSSCAPGSMIVPASINH